MRQVPCGIYLLGDCCGRPSVSFHHSNAFSELNRTVLSLHEGRRRVLQGSCVSCTSAGQVCYARRQAKCVMHVGSISVLCTSAGKVCHTYPQAKCHIRRYAKCVILVGRPSASFTSTGQVCHTRRQAKSACASAGHVCHTRRQAK